MNKIYLN